MMNIEFTQTITKYNYFQQNSVLLLHQPNIDEKIMLNLL